MERNSFLYKVRRTLQIMAHHAFADDTLSKFYYRVVLKKKLNLTSPRLFNEKLQWLKLYYFPKNPLVVKCSDKYTVREHIESKGYGEKLVPLLGVWDDARSIIWDALPKRFVLKCTHGCAYNIVVSDKNRLDKKATVKQLNKWLQEDFGAFNIELHYSQISSPMIICEEFLGDCITDYKFFCFNGKPKYMYVSRDLFHDRQAQIGFFYMSGKKMPLQRKDYTNIACVELPVFFDEMKEIAQDLSTEFPFVRVDFFIANNTYYFAELTFTPGACMIPFNPEKYDLKWGEQLDISAVMENRAGIDKEYINKIALIGHFGAQENYTDGQTVKTLNLYRELSSHTEWKIIKLDTYYKSKNPFKLFAKLVLTLLTTKKVVILLSGKGMKFFFPILHFCAAVRKTDIYHDVIGGNLAQYVRQYPMYKKYLNSFRVNWVETEKLKTELEKESIFNIEVIPNFRRVKIIDENELKSSYEKPYQFCTFSRVTKEKGIEEAIEAIESINSEKEKVCCLDIYGPVEEAYKGRFDEIMKRTSDCISYCGEVPFEKAIFTLRKYYGVLFPTYWDGEGNAGTVIESFFAGVPVIATNWRCNNEMIISGYNGLLYPSDYANDLEDGVRWLMGQENRIQEIKKICLQSARRYLPDEHIKTIVSTIQGK